MRAVLPAGLAVLLAFLLCGGRPGFATDPAGSDDPEARLARIESRSVAAHSTLGSGRPLTWKELRRIEADLIDLFRDNPENPAVAEALGRFYSGWRDLDVPSPALLPLVGKAREPVVLARRIRGEQGGGAAVVRVLLATLAARPSEPILWKLAADAAYWPEWKAAFLREALRTLGGRAPEAAVAVAGELVETEIQAGLPAEALATLAGLPPAMRARLLSGPLSAFKVDVGGQPMEIPARDLRLDLAIAFALTGDPARAAELEKSLAPLPPEPPRAWMERSTTPSTAPVDPDHRARRILDRWLRPTSGEPFELLGDAMVSLSQAWKTDRLLLLIRLAEREGYPEMVAYAERYAVLGSRMGKVSLEGAEGLPSGVAANARRLAAARESLRQSFGIVKSARPLRAPLVRYEERPLPEGPTHGEPSETERGLGGEAWRRRPKAFQGTKFDQEGKRAVVVGWFPEGNQRLAGWIGNYQAIFSRNGGETWSPPLDTGLRQTLASRWNDWSAFPLLAGDRLQIEITRQENDPDLVVPPAYLANPHTVTRSSLLTLPLADLRRDTDGDGLTDLAEQQLLTDPEDPDTDHDGLPDAADPLPGVPFSDSPAAASRGAAVAAALQEITGSDPGAFAPGENPASDFTIYLMGDLRVLTGFQPVRRTVALTFQEADEAREKLGLRTTLGWGIFFDHAEKRALVVWSIPMEGGVLHLEATPRGWKVAVLGNWIS